MKYRRFFLNLLASILLFLVIVTLMTGCSPKFTEPEARKLFGCKNDSTRTDTITKHTVDTFYSYTEYPLETIVIHDPCDEIKAMKPGESKTKKGVRTTCTYGKDTTGKSFFKCDADAFKDSMVWYKEQWKTTVTNTVFQSDPKVELSRWQTFLNGFKDVSMYLFLIALVVLVVKFWRG